MLDYNFNEFVIINSLYFFFIIYLEEDFFLKDLIVHIQI